MPSKDTLPFHLTRKTIDEIERIRKAIAKDLGIDIENVTKKHGEIALRLKGQRGKLKIDEIRDILLGKIK